MSKSYTYYSFDKQGKEVQTTVELTAEQEAQAEQAKKNYETSKAWIHKKYVYLWMYSFKAYHLSTEDRQRYLKSWQSNVAFGLIRSFIDVFVSTLTERPISFRAQGLNEDGLRNASNIEHALAVTADITWFQKESRTALKEGLKTGTFAFAIGMLPPAKKTPMNLMTDNPAMPIQEAIYENEIGDFPFARSLDVFNVFPDIYNGTLRHVTERKVTSLDGILTTFKTLIDDPDNTSPLKGIVPYLTSKKNQNGADFRDFAIIKDQIHQQMNYNFSTENAFNDIFSTNYWQTATTTTSQDQDTDVTDGLIEYLYEVNDYTITIHMNNYPVCLMPNKFGFIPFVLSSTTDEKRPLGCEGIPYLLAGMEKTMNSFMNNYLDGVKSIANPTFIAKKGLFTDEDQLEDLPPGSVLWSEGEVGNNAIQRMDKGTISDYNILDITLKIASQLTGISEYNLGISARERTATGALATTQSSQKRLSPYLETYVSVISRIANLWLILMRQYWTEDKFLVVTGSKEGKLIKNKDLVGATAITLNLDSMFSAIQDFAYKKLLEVYMQTKGTGLINEDEVIKEIFKLQGYDTKRFVPDTAPQVTPPTDIPTAPLTDPAFSEAQLVGQDIQSLSTPQVNFGNEGQGPQ